MTQRLCRCCGDFHDLDKPWPHNCISHFGETGDATFHVISDAIEVRSMLDGKIYDSKSQLRRTYRAAGAREVGNDRQDTISKTGIDRRNIRAALKDAAHKHGLL